MLQSRTFFIIYSLVFCSLSVSAQPSAVTEFNRIANQKGKLIFCDSFKYGWEKQWMLDGEEATVVTDAGKLNFSAGPDSRNNAHHAVLWTKKVFQGDIRVDFDFIRNDTIPRMVNIIYLFAAGSGKAEFKEDISTWNQLRKIPAMQLYFNHMNLYHISFAAFDVDNTKADSDYIRFRRYLPETGNGIIGTEILPDYLRTRFFKPFEKHHICIIRKGNEVKMKVSAKNTEKVYAWNTSSLPPVLSGRIGLRLMASRASIFSNFKVYQLK
jgi:hypothetical protein